MICILIGGGVLLKPEGIVVIVINPVLHVVVGLALLGVGVYAIAKIRQQKAKA